MVVVECLNDRKSIRVFNLAQDVRSPKEDFYAAYHLDNRLNHNLGRILDEMQDDDDYVTIVDGPEGSGKSVFAMQIAKRIDPTFDLDRVCFTPQDFDDCIRNRALPHQAVVFDEAFRGLSSRASISRMNRMLVELMMEMRQKNLFVVIVMPTVFLLERYVLLHRARSLFHVYRHPVSKKRGFWGAYRKEKMLMLYDNGKKTYDYRWPTHSFRGRFTNTYVVDEVGYREKKMVSFQNRELDKVDKGLDQRNRLFWFIKENTDLSLRDMHRELKPYGVFINDSSISKAISSVRDNSKL